MRNGSESTIATGNLRGRLPKRARCCVAFSREMEAPIAVMSGTSRPSGPTPIRAARRFSASASPYIPTPIAANRQGSRAPTKSCPAISKEAGSAIVTARTVLRP